MAAHRGTRCLRVPPELAGQRLDRVLVALAPDLTRGAAQRLLKEGGVRVDGAPARAADKAAAGQLVTIDPAAPRPLDLVAEEIALDIVFEDEALLVVNKPPGMVVHPAHGHHSGTLVNALLAHCRLSSGTGDARPGIVHRLDRDTSGLLLVAKGDAIHAKLSRMVEEKSVSRRYVALVWGVPNPPRGRVETQMGRHPRQRTMMAVLPPGQGRLAVTDYEAAEGYGWEWREAAEARPRRREASLARCALQTGRTHQIRVHLAHLGHPLLGDPLYGDAVRDGGGPEDLRGLIGALTGQALHAAELAFTHPLTGQALELVAPPPTAVAELLAWLREHSSPA